MGGRRVGRGEGRWVERGGEGVIGCGGEGEGAGFVGDLAGNWLDKTGFQTGRSRGGGKGGARRRGGEVQGL